MKKFSLYFLSFIMIFSVCFVFSGCGDGMPESHKYSMTLEYDDSNKTLNGNMEVDFINNSNLVLKELCFHLYPNAFREGAKFKPVSFASEQKAYPNGKSYGHIEISSVKMSNSDLEFSIVGEDENILSVKLKGELYPNSRIIVNISFKSVIPNINHRYGYGNDTINLGNFYPIACMISDEGFNMHNYSYNGDPFFSDVAKYDVTLKYPEKYIVASSGELVTTKTKDGYKIDNYESLSLRDFAIVMSDKFEVLCKESKGINVKYYYFKDQRPYDSLETAIKTMNLNSKLIGKYPYKSVSVVESNFVHGGMEFPQLVMISDALEYEDYTNVIVHELGHQWWYNVVGNDEFNYGWLDEGLTEYTTALFYENYPEYNIKFEEIMNKAIRNYSMFIEIYSSVYGSVDTSMNRPLNDFSTEPEYVHVAYTKGMLLFDTLRNLIGDKKFFKSLTTYYEMYKFKNAIPQDLIAIFESNSSVNLENFFNSWIDGRVVIIN